MNAWYNEIDPFAAQWIENLAAAGHVAAGTVERRSICDLEAGDVPVGQAHFFAGIGGWSRALRLAGWPDGVPVWTGSCPCQPFSDAGDKRGFADERHLWPVWFELIRQRKPPVVFGEQVASGSAIDWIDAVSADLEGEGYAVGAAILPACGVGSPHRRERLYFAAVADSVANHDGERFDGVDVRARWRKVLFETSGRGADGRSPLELGDAEKHRRAEERQNVDWSGGGGRAARVEQRSERGGAWDSADWLLCRDNKYRPVEPGTFPLAHGVPARVGRLRGYGNAIVPELAATFIRAVMEWLT